MTWAFVIAAIALLFSIGCFYLFVAISTAKPVPDDVVDAATARAQTAGLDPATLGALAKALAEAFSKVGPAALALIGAILFLLLAGAAAGVYQFTDGKEKSAQTPKKDKDTVKEGDGNRTDTAPANKVGETENTVGNAT